MQRELMRVSGILNRGHVGHILYYVSFDRAYRSIRVRLHFEKQTLGEIPSEYKREISDAMERHFGRRPGAGEILLAARGMKTELNLAAYLNGAFIGGSHRADNDKSLLFAPGYASEGCFPQQVFEGVLRVDVIVFNVLCDGTPYGLEVSAEEENDVPKN